MQVETIFTSTQLIPTLQTKLCHSVERKYGIESLQDGKKFPTLNLKSMSNTTLY